MEKSMEIKQIDGLSLVAKGKSGHWTVMDTRSEVGGHEGATAPMELILMGLGGCTSMDVISILKKMKAPLKDYSMEIFSERAEEHPKVFTKIHIKYIFYGTGIKEEQVKKAIKLSEDRYCSASAMLKKAVDITNEYEIREE